MYYFAIVDIIAKWMKNQGGIVYWVYLFTVGIIGATTIIVWLETSFWEAKYLLTALIVIWLGGSIPVSIIEKRRNTPTNKDGSE